MVGRPLANEWRLQLLGRFKHPWPALVTTKSRDERINTGAADVALSVSSSGGTSPVLPQLPPCASRQVHPKGQTPRLESGVRAVASFRAFTSAAVYGEFKPLGLC